ncbi:hypothetical protein HCN44_004190 [Aphidius gifuensis]|uniref:Uncharacterized protein n=1 Tax=Aphidius gifuensis TaxID=684658 RepID=A0A834XYQ2_APHGI|nr:protein orai-2-like [Aphidius gifuensis]KAF7994718.1 hypothetical protein HCN44_004190 [Aphidius gifuensis]
MSNSLNNLDNKEYNLKMLSSDCPSVIMRIDKLKINNEKEEEIIKKLNKSTQIDFSNNSKIWKAIPNRKPRPLSLSSGYIQKSNHYNQTIINTPKNLLYESKSEVVLSPRTRINTPNKFVSLDIDNINNQYKQTTTTTTTSGSLYTPYSESNISNSCCNCCCNCTNNAKQSNHNKKLIEDYDHDGPQGLSWRRLHMSRAKLKATATTSELLSGFAMVAMVELQINDPTTVPEWLFIMFAVCTTVLVSVHIFALMISTYLLPNVEAISKLQIASLITESPHERMRGFIELAWAFSTVLGLFLFLVEVAILCWVKFWDYSIMAATASTIIVIPVLIVFVAFAVHFYHSLVVYKCETSISDLEELESIKKKLDNVQTSV